MISIDKFTNSSKTSATIINMETCNTNTKKKPQQNHFNLAESEAKAAEYQKKLFWIQNFGLKVS